ncbi:MAG: Uncharacterised protein [Formosa sp. Hel3_A1_48]|nr:MAG: Uncharacterised protein [Formosa sp. Hel3_A1_48]
MKKTEKLNEKELIELSGGCIAFDIGWFIGYTGNPFMSTYYTTIYEHHKH